MRPLDLNPRMSDATSRRPISPRHARDPAFARPAADAYVTTRVAAHRESAPFGVVAGVRVATQRPSHQSGLYRSWRGSVTFMAVPKICGIETEYGIVVRGAESNPVTASSQLINAYVAATAARRGGAVGWDFEDEHPATDARGFTIDTSMAPEVETTLVNAVLTNGARYYVDHAHPEISTPEVANAHDAVRFDRAAEEIVRASMDHARTLLRDGAEIVVYKNNSDGKGNSYGCHENYLLSRLTPFGQIVRQVTPHFVTRQVFAGAGKVGCELADLDTSSVPLPAQPAGRLLRGGGRAGDHDQATDREHPRRTALRCQEVPAPPRHRRRCQHERGRDLPQGRHDSDRAGDDRGRCAR